MYTKSLPSPTVAIVSVMVKACYGYCASSNVGTCCLDLEAYRGQTSRRAYLASKIYVSYYLSLVEPQQALDRRASLLWLFGFNFHSFNMAGGNSSVVASQTAPSSRDWSRYPLAQFRRNMQKRIANPTGICRGIVGKMSLTPLLTLLGKVRVGWVAYATKLLHTVQSCQGAVDPMSGLCVCVCVGW